MLVHQDAHQECRAKGVCDDVDGWRIVYIIIFFNNEFLKLYLVSLRDFERRDVAVVALAAAVAPLVHAEKVVSHLAEEMRQVRKSTAVVLEAVHKEHNALALLRQFFFY